MIKLKKFLQEKPLLTFFGVLLAIACIAAAPASRDYLLSTLVVYPAASENGTNSVRFADKAGTSWVAVSPTNAQLIVQWQSTNYTALMNTNLYLTNGGVAYPVKIRNGLWVN